jgi:hypothetical protein
MYKQAITSPPSGVSPAAADCLIRRLRTAGVSFDRVLAFDPNKDPESTGINGNSILPRLWFFVRYAPLEPLCCGRGARV